MKVEMWPLDRVHPYENNPRIADGAVDAVAESIKAFGFRQPVVTDEAGILIAGHTRFQAAQKLGLKKIPVHVAKGLTPQQVQAYRLVDNRTHDLSWWDFDKLPAELDGLDDIDLEPFKFDAFQPITPEELDAEWQDMPEFTHPALPGYHRITVSFETREDYEAFAKLIGQTLTETTKAIWYPKHDQDQVNRGLAYTDEPEAEE